LRALTAQPRVPPQRAGSHRNNYRPAREGRLAAPARHAATTRNSRHLWGARILEADVGRKRRGDCCEGRRADSNANHVGDIGRVACVARIAAREDRHGTLGARNSGNNAAPVELSSYSALFLSPGPARCLPRASRTGLCLVPMLAPCSVRRTRSSESARYHPAGIRRPSPPSPRAQRQQVVRPHLGVTPRIDPISPEAFLGTYA
jgi:hypothetical protein